MNKRTFLKSIGLLTVANSLLSFTKAEESVEIPNTIDDKLLVNGEFTLPNLPYAYDALEGKIDKATMEIHHSKHHKAYVDNLNKAVKEAKTTYASLEEICKRVDKKTAMLLRNNAGGHWNHSFFWESLTPTEGTQPSTNTNTALVAAFGTIDAFKEAFTKEALGRFGSGWAWLCKDKKGKLFITSTPNQDNPLMTKVVDKVGVPILGIDVWEHAYYLKYQNKRADYVKAFFSIINWAKVEERFNQV